MASIQIDQKIVTLIGQRLRYVKRAGQLKKHQLKIHDQARENKILTLVGNQAKQQGYPANIARQVFIIILKSANDYEKQHHQFKQK